MFNNKYIYLFDILAISNLALLSTPAHAADNIVCVSTATALRNALLLAASNGKADIIQVVQGTYTGSFVHPGPSEAFNLTLQGGYTANCASRVLDPINTILDGNQAAIPLAISIANATANVTVKGLTLRNGDKATNGNGGGVFISLGAAPSQAFIQRCRFETNRAYYGGGAYIAGAATLTGNTFSGNTGSYEGGGSYISGAATLTSNTFSGNTGRGGGAYISGAATLTSNTFSGNNGGWYGGGAYFTSTATLTNNTFSGNSTPNGGCYLGCLYAYGGGAYFIGTATLTSNTFSGNTSYYGGEAYFAGTATLTSNTFSDNAGNNHGGGSGAYFASASTLTSNTFSGNTGRYDGGGAYFSGNRATIVNNVFSGNSSTSYEGGGAWISPTTAAILINNSFNKNSAKKGGGLALTLPGDETLNTSILANNLFWANTASSGEAADLWLNNDADGDYSPTALALFVNNAFDQNYPAGYASAGPILLDASNLDKVDPLFIDANAHDLHLQAGSPVINKGNTTVPGLPTTDRDGNARVVGASVDIGAYEYHSNAPTAPAVSTDAPSVITATSATLKGTVNPKGAATNVTFDFGSTTDYGTSITATPATIAATAAVTTVSANKTGLACGRTYHYRVKAVNSVGSTNGADKAFTTSSCPPVDLVITNLTLNTAKPVTGTAFSAVVTVKNQGTSPTAASKLKLWANKIVVPTCTTAADKIVDVGTIAAGGSINITVTGLISNVVGINTLRAFADGTCLVTETNETNNHRTLNYRIGARMADLVITSIALTPATPANNTVFNAAITVKNQGIAAASASYLEVWTNQATAQTCGTLGDAWADVGILATGASKIITINGLNAGTVGAKALLVFVDSWCEETESNEGNNQMIKTYSVQ